MSQNLSRGATVEAKEEAHIFEDKGLAMIIINYNNTVKVTRHTSSQYGTTLCCHTFSFSFTDSTASVIFEF